MATDQTVKTLVKLRAWFEGFQAVGMDAPAEMTRVLVNLETSPKYANADLAERLAAHGADTEQHWRTAAAAEITRLLDSNGS